MYAPSLKQKAGKNKSKVEKNTWQRPFLSKGLPLRQTESQRISWPDFSLTF